MTLNDYYKKFDWDIANYSYIKRILIGIDQLFNVILFNGSQDETISGHIGRKISENRANKIDKFICWFLRKLESKHCLKSRSE